MNVSELLPRGDLLQQVEGVETKLRQGERISLLGWVVLLLAIVPLLPAILVDWVRDSGWPVWTGLAMVLLAVVLINWTRFWIRESRTPFRYTYSVAPFRPVGEEAKDATFEWLAADLCEKLSNRVTRLSRIEIEEAAKVASSHRDDRSHIHISGTYSFRERGPRVEIVPWIRIGSGAGGDVLAHPVRFRLEFAKDGKPASPDDDYEKIAERTYFSVASEIYRQIRRDVERKIDLLPRPYRAAAKFFEAEDYARSNTLLAYEEAEKLYMEVIALHDPEWSETPIATVRSRWHGVRRLLDRARVLWAKSAKSRGDVALPGVMRAELLFARALVGYANTRLFSYTLAYLSGHRPGTVFAARKAAEDALAVLAAFPNMADKRDTVFEAQLALALAEISLSSPLRANAWLRKARRRREPLSSEQEALLLYVEASVEPRLIPKLQLLTRVVELDPVFELAQFDFAVQREMLWRTKDLEEVVADGVFEEYDRVLSRNPGNIAAWANLGYMHWLLQRNDAAAKMFDRGREYKEVKRETFVAELDYGLARIAVENFDFGRAYQHYIAAVTATTAHEIGQADAISEYYFELMGEKTIERFENYRRTAERVWRGEVSDVSLTDRTRSPVSRRIMNSVYAFALNDYGDACYRFYLHTGDESFEERARKAFEYADQQLGSSNVLLQLNLHKLSKESADYDGKYIDRIDEQDPGWRDGNFELLEFTAKRIGKLKVHRSNEKDLREDATKLLEEASQLHAQAALADLSPLKPASQSEKATAKYGERSVRRGVSANGEPPPRLGNGAVNESDQGSSVGAPSRVRIEANLKEAEAARKESEAEKKSAEAEEEKNKADRLDRRLKRVPELYEVLLPHEWLWMKGTDRAEFDVSVFTPPSDVTVTDRIGQSLRLRTIGIANVRRKGHQDRLSRQPAVSKRQWELRWLREFDFVNVRALLAWCELHGDPNEARTVVQHVRNHFLPDFPVLDFERTGSADADDARISADRERALYKHYLLGEPEWWRLKGFKELHSPPDGERADELAEECAEELINMSERVRVPAWFLVSVGDELAELLQARPGLKAANSESVLTIYRMARRRAARAAADEETGIDDERRIPRADPTVLREGGEQLVDRPQVLAAVGKRFESLQQWNDALESYRGALNAFSARGAEVDEADCRVGVSRALWALGLRDDAMRELGRASEGGVWRQTRIEITQTLDTVAASDSAARSVLRDWLRGEQRSKRQAQDVVGHRDAVEALHWLALQESVGGWEPGNRPAAIALEGHPAFFPQLDETPAVKHMINQQIPDMRDRVLTDLGVSVPGVRIRPNADLPEHGYRVVLNEVAVTSGTVPSESDTTDHDEFGRYRFMVERVEHAVRLHIVDFFGIDEAIALLRGWQGIEDRWRDERRRVLDHDQAPAKFVETLRGLLREGVSVSNLGTILELIGGQERTVDEAVDAVRTAAGAEAVTARSNRFLAAPPVLEGHMRSSLRGTGTAPFVAVPTEDAARLRNDVKAWLADADADVTFVVSDPSLRLSVRKFMSHEFPQVRVVSLPELPRHAQVETVGQPGIPLP